MNAALAFAAGCGVPYLKACFPDDRAVYRAIAEAGAKLREGERKDLAVRIAEGTRKVIDGK